MASSQHSFVGRIEGAYLPWERFQGFMWGVPATWWKVIAHPIKSFGSRPQAGWMRAWAWALVIATPFLYFDYLFSMLFYLLGNILIRVPGLEFPWGSILAAILLPLTLPLDLFVNEALPLRIVFWVFTLKKIPLSHLMRVCFYCLALSPLYLYGFRIGFAVNIALAIYYYMGIIAVRPESRVAAAATCLVHILFRYEMAFFNPVTYGDVFRYLNLID